jgi:hypothetical protein
LFVSQPGSVPLEVAQPRQVASAPHAVHSVQQAPPRHMPHGTFGTMSPLWQMAPVWQTISVLQFVL